MSKKTASIDITVEVPIELRKEMDNYEDVLPSLVTNYLLARSNLGFSEILGFLNGAMTHQEHIRSTEGNRESKTFKGKIVDVKTIERRGNGFLLGRKAVIVFEGTSQNGGVEEQEITTGWIEYNGWDKATQSFTIALANTIMEIAENNIGKECFLRKAFYEEKTAKGGFPRYLANLEVSHAAGDQDDDDDDDDSSGDWTSEEVRKLAPKGYSLGKDDRDILVEMFNDVNGDKLIDEVAKEWDLEKGEVKSLRKAKELHEAIVELISGL